LLGSSIRWKVMKFRNSLDDVVQVPATKTLSFRRCWIRVAISLDTSKDAIRKFLYLFYVFNCPKKKPLCCLILSKHESPSKRRKLFTQPHSLIRQKTWIFQTRTLWSLSATADVLSVLLQSLPIPLGLMTRSY